MYILCKCWITLLFICLSILRVNTYKAEQIIRRGPGQDPQCADPLINSFDTFPDASFSSSSVWKNATDFQPFRARLTEVYGSNEHTSGYAWCPNTHVEDGLREWIQAEFSHLVIISVIFTAGRGDGNVKEYMPNFVLRYQREDNGIWYEHVKSDGTRVLKANNDPRNIARTTLDSVVIAKRIRIYPYSHRSKQQVCLRFALYGCDFPDGVISYSMPQGDIVTYGRQLFGSPYSIPQSFQDLTYDGQLIESENQLIGGIGQLMDNVAYLGNVSQHSDSHPTQPGFHFIGWHIPNKDLRIIFKFDEVRNFIWLRLFTFDSVPLKSRVFSRALVEFSMDGKIFDKSIEILTNHARVIDPNQISPTRLSSISDDIQSSARLKRTSNTFIQDTIIYNNHEWDGALVVQIPLTSHTARYVSLTLTSSDSWILLSEVQFNSTIVQSNSMPLLSNTREHNKSLKKPLDNNSNYLEYLHNSQKLLNKDENSLDISPLIDDNSDTVNKQELKNLHKSINMHSSLMNNEKLPASSHEIRSAEENYGNPNENHYYPSTSISSTSSSSSSTTTSSIQLPQIIVIVSYVLGGILTLFIILAIVIIVQRRCKHYLHFKHNCCKQQLTTIDTGGISTNPPSGGFYSPISLIGTCSNNSSNIHNGVNSLLNYNVLNTMNIPEAAKLLQSFPTLSPNTRTTTTAENFVHSNNNCISNGGNSIVGGGCNGINGSIQQHHYPTNLLQFAVNNTNNSTVTDSNAVIVNSNNNNNNTIRFGNNSTVCASGITGMSVINKLDYSSSIVPPPPPPLPTGLLLPCIPQTGGIGINHYPRNNDQHIGQTNMYMQTNTANHRLAATTFTGSDLNSLNGMSPEYASASIFGFTPPPSDLSDGASIHCGDNNNISNYYRPVVSRLGNNQQHPITGLTPSLNSNYNGPSHTLPITGPTYELHTTTHILPSGTTSNTNNSNNNNNNSTHNNEQYYASNLNQPTATGFLFLPRSQIGNTGNVGVGITGDDTMMNRISFNTSQFQQPNHINMLSSTNNNGFISTLGGDLYNIYQTNGINLPVQQNLQMPQQNQQQMYSQQQNHHQQQQQQTDYKFIQRSDENVTWQLSSSSSGNRQSIILNSTPQQLSPSLTTTEQCLNSLETSWTGTVNNNNNYHRMTNLTGIPNNNGTLKTNYFLPIMNTSTTLNSNDDSHNDEQQITRSYFPSNHHNQQPQLMYSSAFPIPPPRIIGTLTSGSGGTTQSQTTTTTASTTQSPQTSKVITPTSNEPNFSRSSPVGAAATATISTGSGIGSIDNYKIEESSLSGPPSHPSMSFFSVCI
ncbi:hypothetical protein MN116_006651 [Schistosoma mekongi]|uniref:F5/8 type C domain-containing protein n=1 Tax=Schistosoma mekongi TaxID=38744 RepID=A0AAE2D2P7_SCHME|nr:hypothetical protein MN116_006651 [Schistosoma mekongi]